MLGKEFISVIIPTLNEAQNIAVVLGRAVNALESAGVEYEILIVDDASADNTVSIAEKTLGNKGKVISRVSDEKSLSLSVLEGIRIAKGNIIVVMDGDGSHPPEIIPQFINSLRQGYDLAIGSRYVKGGGTRNFPFTRRLISRVSCCLGRLVTPVIDNTSGFLCIRKERLEGVDLTPPGFKVGLEIFVKVNFNKHIEIPYIFLNRQKGESKLKFKTALEFLSQILRLLKYNISKARK